MDGLFQLLIIVFFIVASVFDAISRNRKKQEQKERMEAEEAAEAREGAGAPSRPRPSPREGARTRREADPAAPHTREGRRKAPMGARTDDRSGSRTRGPGQGDESRTRARGGEGGEGAPRETADRMIPEDFWAILTGQAPPSGTPRSEGSPAEAGRSGETPPREPRIPVPVPSDRLPSEASSSREGERTSRRDREEEAASESAITRRSSRWMEGLDDEGRIPASGEAPRRPRTRSPLAGGDRSFPAPPPRPASPFARRTHDPMAEPWGQLEDISQGEIGDGRGAVQGAVELGEGARRRQGASDSPYVRLVSTGRQEDLKAAIVLREVLGAPVGARREETGTGGGWRWEE